MPKIVHQVHVVPSRSLKLIRPLHQLAANSPYSSPDIRRDFDGRRPDPILDPVLKRLHSAEAKWFVRLLLKSFSPVEIPERLVLEQFHFLLPGILSLQNDFDAALNVLTQPAISKLPPRPGKDELEQYRAVAPQIIKPQLGIMIQRQPCDKAWSVKHACQIADERIVSVERKYDGEYCQNTCGGREGAIETADLLEKWKKLNC